jgi:signal transduction histidine kinase
MKDKLYAHVGSLMGGMVHNLNTPLMWVMGRAQLIESRNDRIEMLSDLSEEEFLTIREKNSKDISSIQDGADRIDQILKSLGYKIQMISEGHTSIELREYLQMEIDFLMADMRFKHETNREITLDSRSHYVKSDYNALSYAVIGIINTILASTPKGRTLRIVLDDGVIRLGCQDMVVTSEIKQEIEQLCQGLDENADIILEGSEEFEISLCMKDA